MRPLKELKAYTRVNVPAGEAREATLRLTLADFSYYDRNMEFGPHNGDHTLILGNSSEDEQASLRVRVRNGKLLR